MARFSASDPLSLAAMVSASNASAIVQSQAGASSTSGDPAGMHLTARHPTMTMELQEHLMTRQRQFQQAHLAQVQLNQAQAQANAQVQAEAQAAAAAAALANEVGVGNEMNGTITGRRTRASAKMAATLPPASLSSSMDQSPAAFLRDMAGIMQQQQQQEQQNRAQIQMQQQAAAVVAANVAQARQNAVNVNNSFFPYTTPQIAAAAAAAAAAASTSSIPSNGATAFTQHHVASLAASNTAAANAVAAMAAIKNESMSQARPKSHSHSHSSSSTSSPSSSRSKKSAPKPSNEEDEKRPLDVLMSALDGDPSKPSGGKRKNNQEKELQNKRVFGGPGADKVLQAAETATNDGKPYACTWAGCSKAFKQMAHLKIHERCHTGDKPYVSSFVIDFDLTDCSEMQS